MINEKTHRQIEKDGLKNDFKLGNCGGELDVNGDYVFVIRLLPTGNRLAKIQEQKRTKAIEDFCGGPTEMIYINGKRIDPSAYGHQKKSNEVEKELGG